MVQNAGLFKRFLACIYELLLLIAIWLLCTWFFVMLFGHVDTSLKRISLQILLWLISGAYFITCWVKIGQTPASQAWKVKLINQHYQLLSINLATQRYIWASFSLLAFGVGFLWVLIDKEHLFMHDRILGTRLIKLD